MAEAICKRCIHHDICDSYSGFDIVTFFPYNEDCEYFKNKADVIQIVQCEDCKYWKSQGFDHATNMKFGICNCEQWETDDFYTQTYETDFCSYGAKMNGKDEQ